MDAAEWDRWQTELPVDRADLELILAGLQARWMAAQKALLPSLRLGNGDAVQREVTALERQIRVVEDRLTR